MVTYSVKSRVKVWTKYCANFYDIVKALLYYSVLTCSPSLIHLLLTHLMPSEVGHAPCRDIAVFTLNLTIRCKYNTVQLSWQSPIKVVPEYSGPRAGPGCHAHVGKGGEASHQVREVEHHLQYSAIIQFSIVQEEVELYRGHSVPHPHSAGVPVRAHLWTHVTRDNIVVSCG